MGKIFIGVCALALFSGCATTQVNRDSQMQHLQERLSYLEEEIQSKNQRISELEQERDAQMRAGFKTDQDSRYARTAPSHSMPASGEMAKVTNKQIQTALRNAGYYQGAIDGKIGPKTKEAIKAFQKDNELKPDGVVGRRTWAKLRGYL